jgi:hypothetical protein
MKEESGRNHPCSNRDKAKAGQNWSKLVKVGQAWSNVVKLGHRANASKCSAACPVHGWQAWMAALARKSRNIRNVPAL